MKLALVTISAILGVILVGVCLVYSSKNGAISLEESVNAAKSGIDVQLVNRFNKLTELAECVKKYDEHEYKTLLEVIEARGKNMSANDAKQCIAAVNAVAEQYPELKSQSNYSQLMTEISLMENHLAQGLQPPRPQVPDQHLPGMDRVRDGQVRLLRGRRVRQGLQADDSVLAWTGSS